jgi:hypothetical protein
MPQQPIPIIDARGKDAAFVAAQLPDQVANILDIAGHSYSMAGLRLGDALSRQWLARNATPYRTEIDALAAHLHRPGGHMLNVSYEWACTTGIGSDHEQPPVMLRVLDWALDGLGRNLVVIRQSGPAGEWINMGWPGFVGAITALAPGRFVAALNQPPLVASRFGTIAGRLSWRLRLACDWLAVRPAVWRSRAIPPAHLLRQVFDEAKDFDEAVERLAQTPLSASAFFAVSGAKPGEACVIERLPDASRIRTAGTGIAVANHWAAFPRKGLAYVGDSELRKAQMEQALATEADPFSLAWLTPPILNQMTQVAAVADAASGRMVLQGWERTGAATARLDTIFR